MSETPEGAVLATDHALALRLVTECGDLAQQMHAAGVDTEYKSSLSDVVTAADRACEALVVSVTQQERSSDGVLGEEGASLRGTSGRRWVIDPVDGTHNFTMGIPYWCSALALEGSDGALLGAVYQPSTAEVWLGGAGAPTTRNGVPVAALVPRRLDECVLATYLHPATLRDPNLAEPWFAIVGDAATARMFGSGSCDLASVASGRMDLWVQHSTAEWDWPPGKALVDAAGGRTAVVRHRGHTWHIAGNPRAVGDVLDVLRLS